MDFERQYFSEFDEWSTQEREFANRAIDQIGVAAWQDLLKVRQERGNDAFISALKRIWPDGMK